MTEQNGKEIHELYERLARQQMGLDEQWKLSCIAVALPVGLEDEIDRLSMDSELCDSERWQELASYSAPLAWLPKGILLVTMFCGEGESLREKSGFITAAEVNHALSADGEAQMMIEEKPDVVTRQQTGFEHAP